MHAIRSYDEFHTCLDSNFHPLADFISMLQMAFNEMGRQSPNSGFGEEDTRRHYQPTLRFGQKINFFISQEITMLNSIDARFQSPLQNNASDTVSGHWHADPVSLIHCSLDFFF